MLIYLIIAAELAILYTVFWYVYVKDPKPYQVKGHPWGRYGQAGHTAGSVDPTLQNCLHTQTDTVLWWQPQLEQDSYPEHVQYYSTSHVERSNTLRYRRTMLQLSPLKHAAAASAQQQEESNSDSTTFFSRVMMMFDRTLGALNVKTL